MKKLNRSIVNSIIHSDFLFVDSYAKKNVPIIQSSKVAKLPYKVHQLSLVETLKTIKQFIRLMQFLKKKQGSLFVLSPNKQIYKFLTFFFQIASIDITSKLATEFPKKMSKTLQPKLMLFLDSFLKQNINYYKLLAKHNFFLIQSVNSDNEFKNFGTYKIYNNLLDNKKLIFLGILINKVLN